MYILAKLLKEEVSYFLLVCCTRAFHFWKTVFFTKACFSFLENSFVRKSCFSFMENSLVSEDFFFIFGKRFFFLLRLTFHFLKNSFICEFYFSVFENSLVSEDFFLLENVPGGIVFLKVFFFFFSTLSPPPKTSPFIFPPHPHDRTSFFWILRLYVPVHSSSSSSVSEVVYPQRFARKRSAGTCRA